MKILHKGCLRCLQHLGSLSRGKRLIFQLISAFHQSIDKPDRVTQLLTNQAELHNLGNMGAVPYTTVVSAYLISQFGLILWQKTSDGAHFFLVRATKKIKTVLDQKIPQKNYRRCKSIYGKNQTGQRKAFVCGFFTCSVSFF